MHSWRRSSRSPSFRQPHRRRPPRGQASTGRASAASPPGVWSDLVCTASAISGTPDPQLKVGLYGDIGSVLDATSHKWIVACFDKTTGKPRWEKIATTGVP